jgi:CheY-like chemotaxis protein
LKHAYHTILLVEDDPDDAQMINEALEGLPSINMVIKKNGLEGLHYLEESKKNNLPLPCLIILDMNMPVLDGKKLLAILKNENDFQSIPVVVFTTSSNENDRDYCERFNVPMITKPNDMNSFNLTVRGFLDHCPATA